jgi:dienelactone hydrolase
MSQLDVVVSFESVTDPSIHFRECGKSKPNSVITLGEIFGQLDHYSSTAHNFPAVLGIGSLIPIN